MQIDSFAGDKKVGRSVLGSFEVWLEKGIWLIPNHVQTYHLTMTTVLWSGLAVVFGYFAKENTQWLWGVSAAVLLQYITDFFDGKIGKKRNTGLIKWGFYMDHFLDYIFLCSILAAYSFLIPAELLFWEALAAFSIIGFMVNSYLRFAATNQFKISFFKIGPTEGRLLFILANASVVFFGVEPFLGLIPYAAFFSFFGLCILVYLAHKKIWLIDMEAKKKA